MPRPVAGTFRKSIRPSSDKYQVSVYLNLKEAEAIKAIALAKEISVSSVAANLIKEGLTNEKYETVIKAYQQFKEAVE